jgi:hypothetical protein
VNGEAGDSARREGFNAVAGTLPLLQLGKLTLKRNAASRPYNKFVLSDAGKNRSEKAV